VSKRDPWTSIPVKTSTKKLLRKFIGTLSQKTGEDYSMDTIIQALISYAPEIPVVLVKEKTTNKT